MLTSLLEGGEQAIVFGRFCGAFGVGLFFVPGCFSGLEWHFDLLMRLVFVACRFRVWHAFLWLALWVMLAAALMSRWCVMLHE